MDPDNAPSGIPVIVMRFLELHQKYVEDGRIFDFVDILRYREIDDPGIIYQDLAAPVYPQRRSLNMIEETWIEEQCMDNRLYHTIQRTNTSAS